MACAEVVPVPTLSDNYAYLFIDRKTNTAGCVDPAEPEKVVEEAKRRGVSMTTCLCTHKHWDHAGGNEKLKQLLPDIEIVGSAYEATPGLTRTMRHGDILKIGELEVQALHAPCHTAGHLLYVLRGAPSSVPVLFTGDTLFVGGCGKFFEGSAAEMQKNMELIKTLPRDTLIYCGHEYTVSNLHFAVSVDPTNAKLREKLELSVQLRKEGRPTIPTTVGEESDINPFMRADAPELQAVAGAGGDPVETLRVLREKKNMFKAP